MTRFEADAIDIRRDWVEVRDVVAGAVERARRAFPKRKVQASLPDGMPLVPGDAALLEQVLFNLLDNANKYSGEGSMTKVAATTTPTCIVLTVTEQGIGIPADEFEMVFEKFYRVAGSDGRVPGIGLGLSICAGIVRGMGGTIRAESPVADGRGRTIVIELPVAASTPTVTQGGRS